MLPEYPEFKRLETADQTAIAKYLGLARRTICELSLANFILWKDFDNALLTMINNNLCILINPLNEPAYFLEPLGNNEAARTVDLCLKHAGRISRASHDLIARLPKHKYRCACLRGQFDYIYSTGELAELKGKKFDGKRNRINKFAKLHPDHSFAGLKPEVKPEALALFEKWFKKREESKFFPKMAYVAQRSALEAAFLNFEKLKLSGGCVMAGKSLAGFVIGSELNPGTIDLHFSYADPEIAGASQFMLQQACRTLFSSYKLINLEQDLGIPGLRKAKLSYHPLRLEKKFEITA